jgi:hypothetical protein
MSHISLYPETDLWQNCSHHRNCLIYIFSKITSSLGFCIKWSRVATKCETGWGGGIGMYMSRYYFRTVLHRVKPVKDSIQWTFKEQPDIPLLAETSSVLLRPQVSWMKVKVVKHHDMKMYWNGGIAPLILWPRHWMEVSSVWYNTASRFYFY